MNKIVLDRELTLDSARQIIQDNHKSLRAFSLKSLAIFGSVARSQATVNSDVDILIEFSGAATFDNYMDLKFFLEDIFGRSVDLVTKKSLKLAIRQQILEEAIYVPFDETISTGHQK